MIKIKKARYRVCFQLKENIWKNNKVLKLKRKKWIQIQHFLKRKFKYNYSFFLKKNKFFKKKFNMRNFYITLLNFKKYLVNIYGPMRIKFLKKKIKSSRFKGISLQVKQQKQHLFLKGSMQNDRLFYIINSFENMLAICLYRSNYAKSIFESYQLIAHGFVSVNNQKVINPKFLVKNFDIITIKVPNMSLKAVFKKNDFIVSNHLLFNSQNKICVKTTNIYKNITNLHWNLSHYLLKSKRRK
jgi:ribosomal protein S4